MDRRVFLGALAMMACGPAMAATPGEVLIIRHAEEPGRGDNAHLNDEGRARAAALPKLFAGRFAPPTVLFAARSSRESARSVETLEPLAARLHLRIDDTFSDEKYQKLAEAILTGRQYEGTHILICWHHATIPELAAALGAHRPPLWPDKQYDHIWQLRFKGKTVTLTDEPQRIELGSAFEI
jgi:broad specificity phosphatase PhoE